VRARCPNGPVTTWQRLPARASMYEIQWIATQPALNVDAPVARVINSVFGC